MQESLHYHLAFVSHAFVGDLSVRSQRT